MVSKKDHKLIRKNNNSVFFISVSIIIFFILWGIFDNNGFTNISDVTLYWIENNFDWLYLIVGLFFIIFCLFLAFSKFGNIKLGDEDSEPEYSTISWFGMLFCAGMGVGLVFWGISEPISHYVSPMPGIEPMSQEAFNFSIKSCFMHWGIHPWATYAIIGLSLAYFQYKRNKPALISCLFEPILGKQRVNGPIGKSIDVFTIVLTVAGIATSFGMACMQISDGLNYVFKIPNTNITWILVISIIAFIYILSTVSGLDKGIKALSDFNLVLAFILLLIGFIIGPTVDILKIFVNGLGQYVGTFIQDSLNIQIQGDNSWLYKWRIFYWAWWIAWAPFTGIFIARISKGRTIREFLIGVILVPAIASIFWFSVFGGLALHVAGSFDYNTLLTMVSSPQTTLYIIFSKYPASFIVSIISIILLISFFITSANSAVFVLSMISSNGNLNPSNTKKVLWGVLLALFAIVLLLSGGLTSLQNISIAASFPFLFIMIGICVNIYKVLRKDFKSRKYSKEDNNVI